jgi:hypothetical protein
MQDGKAERFHTQKDNAAGIIPKVLHATPFISPHNLSNTPWRTEQGIPVVP